MGQPGVNSPACAEGRREHRPIGGRPVAWAAV